MIEFGERVVAGRAVSIHEGERLVFGHTTGDFPASALRELFPSRPLLFVKQVHSDRIVGEAEWRPGVEADGLLLERPGPVAIVQTADCLPLFFYKDDFSKGGVVHVGWRGLLQGIEQKLAARLGRELGKFSFFLGPGIEKKCYEVGGELPDLFAKKAYVDKVFEFVRPGRYTLDLKAGLSSSLSVLGVAPDRILDCGLCTFCSGGRFPSYRRDGKTGMRIFNFLLLKGGDPAGK